MWERGLKPREKKKKGRNFSSLPMWERGLKLSNYLEDCRAQSVAPHVGAWIETCRAH